MRSLLFIGPSLAPARAAAAFDGEIRPPIKRGDLDEITSRSDGPWCIGIVDGQFLQQLSISPKEVVRAIDRGALVYGASSIGALRAVECAPYGMIGVGRVFELFATGELDADDEVAVTFDPDTLLALSEPMVNMRVTFRAAAEAGLISDTTAASAIAVAKGLYFPQRTYARVLREIRGDVPEEECARLARFAGSTDAPDQKGADALALIAMMMNGAKAAVL